MRVVLKVIVGYLATSKKSGLFRWLSRLGSPVSIPATSIVASTVERVTSLSSSCTFPETLPNFPRTVLTIMCFTANKASECAPSISHVEAKTNDGSNSNCAAATFKAVCMYFLLRQADPLFIDLMWMRHSPEGCKQFSAVAASPKLGPAGSAGDQSTLLPPFAIRSSRARGRCILENVDGSTRSWRRSMTATARSSCACHLWSRAFPPGRTECAPGHTCGEACAIAACCSAPPPKVSGCSWLDPGHPEQRPFTPLFQPSCATGW